MASIRKLRVIVIKTPGLDRGDVLISNLGHHYQIDLTVFEAFMVRGEDDRLAMSKDEYDSARALINLGREMLPGEVGCSKSHNYARKLISEISKGGLIMEDDALVTDIDQLVAESLAFLEEKKGITAVLSFYNNEFIPVPCRPRSIKKLERRWTAIKGSPSSTVAYALTSEAAKMLLENNVPIYQLADWPYSQASYYLSNIRIVDHPKDAESSTIEKHAFLRTQLSKKHQVKVLLWIHYFENRRYFNSIYDYFNKLIAPKIHYRLNKILLARKFKHVRK